MREIKFRGLDLMTGEWVYGSHLKTGTGLEYIVPQNLIANQLPQYAVDKETVGQYTGLKNKNGVEIYEGDILKIPDLFETPENTSTTYHNENVYFEKGAFRTEYGVGEDDWDYVTEEGEVIGNIHEHPHLLEVPE